MSAFLYPVACCSFLADGIAAMRTLSINTALVAGMVLLTANLTSTQAFAATKVAFVADQGVGSGSRAVLSLIADEDVDILLIQGDFGYNPGTALQWDANITNALGHDFPVLGVVGNHENYEWPLYQRLLTERMNRAGGITCVGEVGVKASCTFKDLHVVQVARGIYNVDGVAATDGYDDFIRHSFNNSDSPWKVCSWHKNQRTMQAFSKPNETGWEIYDACLDSGAMIVKGHAHTYSRTYLMKNYRNQEVAHRESEMTLEPGRSFAVVSGLGGYDIRPQENDGDWFASVYTQTQGATHGALFCTLEQQSAQCYFKAINGAVPDQFSLKSNVEFMDSNSGTESNPPSGTGVFSRVDKDEFLWIARDNSGQWSRSWISASCARSLGKITHSGDWRRLVSIAPLIDTLTPCDNNISTSPSKELPVGGYVFSRTEKSEYWWIDVNNSAQMGSVWIDKECASRLGGSGMSGNWENLLAVAPAMETLEYPCSTQSLPVLSQSPSTALSKGYVFSRNDKREFWWIAGDTNGTTSYLWIDEACAKRMGGASVWGNWIDLNDIAPGRATIASPC